MLTLWKKRNIYIKPMIFIGFLDIQKNIRVSFLKIIYIILTFHGKIDALKTQKRKEKGKRGKWRTRAAQIEASWRKAKEAAENSRRGGKSATRRKKRGRAENSRRDGKFAAGRKKRGGTENSP